MLQSTKKERFKWEFRYFFFRQLRWSLMLDFGVSTEPYWSELRTKGNADRQRSFPLLNLCWDRMEFNEWGTAQGPGFKCPFLKLRIWCVHNHKRDNQT